MTRLWALGLLAMCVSLAEADILEYVAQPDPSFSWAPGEGGDGYQTLTMRSQTWQGIPWQHVISLHRPATPVANDICVLYITGGSFKPQGSEAVLMSHLAQRMGVPVAVLWNIPNQPLFDDLREDALIAHTFVQAAQTGDESWPLLFPMAKAAVRAMDAISAHAEKAWGHRIDRFVTSGASKRGWTTWFSAVVDPRVVAIAPMVYDNLNLAAQVRHQLELWGTFSASIHDYTDLDLTSLLTSEAGQHLAAIVDPFTYRDKLTMPKLILNGANDQYWTVDSLNLYRDQLVGEVDQLYLPNSNHGMQDRARLINTLAAFVRSVATGGSRPAWAWQHGRIGDLLTLTVQAPTASNVTMWVARRPDNHFTEAQWQSQELTKVGDLWFGSAPAPTEGATAVFGEATFAGVDTPYTLSTTMRLESLVQPTAK